MRRVINTLEKRPDPEIVEGVRELLKICSPSCLVADSMERAGVMHSSIKPLTDSRFVGVALTVRQCVCDIHIIRTLDPLSSTRWQSPLKMEGGGMSVPSKERLPSARTVVCALS